MWKGQPNSTHERHAINLESALSIKRILHYTRNDRDYDACGRLCLGSTNPSPVAIYREQLVGCP